MTDDFSDTCDQHLEVTWPDGGHRIPFRPGPSLREILDSTDLRLPSACGGIGACGQCRVRIEQGEVNPPTDTELQRLGRGLIDQGVRLACQVRPCRDVRISLIERAPSANWRPLDETDCLPTADSGDLVGRASWAGYGVAVDLGTTQIRVSLLDLATGRRLAGRSGLNPQASFGADVLSRLMAAAESDLRALEIGRLAQHAIGEALLDITGQEGIPPAAIRQLAIVGNTAMLCLLAGKNHDLLLQPDNWMREVDCRPTGCQAWCAAWGLSSNTQVEVVQPLAGFVGSDLLAGILATGLCAGPAGTLLIDFGTNSEMALWDGEVAWVTSAAGGPAFEGCGISCGMPAAPGAIYRAAVASDAPGFSVSVLGGGQAKGLCGSGLVDIIAALLRTGRLKHNGRFASASDDQGLDLLATQEGISLKKQDIDALQRAKAAIGAGVQCLLAQAGLRRQDLRRLCVCGAFGRHLDIRNARAIGLLPALPDDKIELCGNTALAGCEILLRSAAGTDVLGPLRSKCRGVNLSMIAGFEDLFIENLFFKPVPIPS